MSLRSASGASGAVSSNVVCLDSDSGVLVVSASKCVVLFAADSSLVLMVCFGASVPYVVATGRNGSLAKSISSVAGLGSLEGVEDFSLGLGIDMSELGVSTKETMIWGRVEMDNVGATSVAVWTAGYLQTKVKKVLRATINTAAKACPTAVNLPSTFGLSSGMPTMFKSGSREHDPEFSLSGRSVGAQPA